MGKNRCGELILEKEDGFGDLVYHKEICVFLFLVSEKKTYKRASPTRRLFILDPQIQTHSSLLEKKNHFLSFSSFHIPG